MVPFLTHNPHPHTTTHTTFKPTRPHTHTHHNTPQRTQHPIPHAHTHHNTHNSQAHTPTPTPTHTTTHTTLKPTHHNTTFIPHRFARGPPPPNTVGATAINIALHSKYQSNGILRQIHIIMCRYLYTSISVHFEKEVTKKKWPRSEADLIRSSPCNRMRRGAIRCDTHIDRTTAINRFYFYRLLHAAVAYYTSMHDD